LAKPGLSEEPLSTSGAEKRLSLYEELRLVLPEQLPAYFSMQRWFGGKARQIRSAELTDLVPLQTGHADALVLLVRVEYESGPGDTYVLPMICSEVAIDQPADGNGILTVRKGGQAAGDTVLTDALQNDEFLGWLLDAIEVKLVSKGVTGQIRASYTDTFQGIRSRAGDDLQPRLLKGEQSNSSIAYGERLILKLFRRVEEGMNPDLEMGLFLTGRAHFPNTPPVAGSLEYQAEGTRSMSIGILQGFVPNQGDAWRFTLDSLKSFWEETAKHEGGPPPLTAETGNLVLVYETGVPAIAAELAGPYLAKVGLLGKRTAQLHLALASDLSDPAFAPEPFTASFQRRLGESAVELAVRNFGLLRRKFDELHPEVRTQAAAILDREPAILEKLQSLPGAEDLGARIRIHGDYHLGQVLYTGSDFIIIDFEGEPARPLSERRTKRSALQDVAGMVRSFHYAAFAHLLGSGGQSQSPESSFQQSARWAQSWYTWVVSRFLNSYFEIAQSGSFLPTSRKEISALLQIHVLEKAVYEMGYELNNRPSWVGIPLAGISQLLAHSSGLAGR
jgi:maltose alpha-D-glucosyltransferase/alpha-amylase